MQLQIDSAAFELKAAEQRERISGRNLLAKQLGEFGAGMAERVGMGEKRLAEREIAMHRPQVEEDVDIEQILRPRAADPVGYALLPMGERAAPQGILRHDPALAIGHARLVEQVGDFFAEPREPAVRRPVRIAFCEDEGVVLIGSEQAFAAWMRSATS